MPDMWFVYIQTINHNIQRCGARYRLIHHLSATLMTWTLARCGFPEQSRRVMGQTDLPTDHSLFAGAGCHN